MSTETRVKLRELREAKRARVRQAAIHAAAERDAEAWNAAHPVGTRTRSIAWRICDHASVMVDGISGGYLLSRVRAR